MILFTGHNGDHQVSFYSLNSVTLDTKVISKINHLESELGDKGRSLFRPFGITQDNKRIYVASNEKIGCFNRQTFEYLGLFSRTGEVNTHQILYHDKHIYRCDTAVNCITRINIHTKEEIYYDVLNQKQVKSLPKTNSYNEKDVLHLNTITFHNGELYAVAHRIGNGGSSYFTLGLNFEYCHEHIEIGMSNHDLVFVNDEIYSLSTHNGALTTIRGDRVIQDHLVSTRQHFLRGMVHHQGLLYIFANIPIFDGVLDCPVDDYAKLFIYDVSNRKVVKEKELKGVRYIMQAINFEL